MSTMVSSRLNTGKMFSTFGADNIQLQFSSRVILWLLYIRLFCCQYKYEFIFKFDTISLVKLRKGRTEFFSAREFNLEVDMTNVASSNSIICAYSCSNRFNSKYGYFGVRT